MTMSQRFGFIGSCLLLVATFVVVGYFYHKTESWFVHDLVGLYIGVISVGALAIVRNVKSTWSCVNISTRGTCQAMYLALLAIVLFLFMVLVLDPVPPGC